MPIEARYHGMSLTLDDLDQENIAYFKYLSLIHI